MKDQRPRRKLRKNDAGAILGSEFAESDDDDEEKEEDSVDGGLKVDGGWRLQKPERAEAVRDFIGERRDEITLGAGDIVVVSVVFDDSWAYGANLRTGEYGVFPLFWIRPTEENSIINME
ncbi:hypothetical protein HDU67_003700 [Dinochytrium kinnereticum]|nr:hypothetical protein HDU67_003700 [Dinochytrium kinnereticum]